MNISIKFKKPRFIDYVTMITPENTNLQMFDQFAEVSKSLKSLAREIEIHCGTVSQLCRGVKDGDTKLSYTMASGGIEQDADVVIFFDAGERCH